MVEPPATFDLLAASIAPDELEPPALARAVVGAGVAGRSLAAGFELTERLWQLADDHRRGVVRLPLFDIERFASDLADTAPDGRPDSASLRRLLLFEVERAHGLLDASATVIGPLSRSDRLRVSWLVGDAQARLQAMTRRPDPFATPPKAWAVSRALAALRALRRAHHRRNAAVAVG